MVSFPFVMLCAILVGLYKITAKILKLGIDNNLT